MRKTSKLLTYLLIAIVSTTGLLACSQEEESESTVSQSTEALTQESTVAEIALGAEEIQNAEKYIDKIVNGSFRERAKFPIFSSINEIPQAVFAGSNLLDEAIQKTGLSSISREDYQSYLQANFHPDIKLNQTSESIFAYDKTNDAFVGDYERSERNFRPFSIFLEPSLTQVGEKYYFDAYELSYEYVNAETGAEEYSNPIARMVVDEVTIGFSTPAQRQDLHLIEYKALAKTRYTLEKAQYGSYHMLSKEMLTRHEAYKTQSMPIFGEVQAVFGQVQGLGGDVLAVRLTPTADAQRSGNLIEGNYVYYVNAFPDTPYYLAAPSSTNGFTFDYSLGFGFMTAEYIK